MRQTINAGLAVLVLSLGLATPVAAGPSEDAGAAYNRGDYATALRLWLPLAVQGDVFAQFALGFMYDKGRGVPSDGVEAVRWYRKAAEQGDAEAQASLGNMYAAGRGVPQDYAQAVRWYRKAAEQGNAEAQASLGNSYATGRGVPQDYAEEIKWTRRAAEQGNACAQLSLSMSYQTGRGVPQDFVHAHMWANLAAAQPESAVSRIATVARDTLAAKMTPAQIAEAQRLAREWKPKSEQRRVSPLRKNGDGRSSAGQS